MSFISSYLLFLHFVDGIDMRYSGQFEQKLYAYDPKEDKYNFVLNDETSHIENGYHDDTTTPSNDIGWGRGRPVYITSKDNETPLAIAKQLQLKPRQSATSALVKQNRMSSGGRLKGLASKSKLYEGTVLLLP